MGEIVPDYRYEDVIIQALPAEYEYVKNKSYGDSDFDLESIRRTITISSSVTSTRQPQRHEVRCRLRRGHEDGSPGY